MTSVHFDFSAPCYTSRASARSTQKVMKLDRARYGKSQFVRSRFSFARALDQFRRGAGVSMGQVNVGLIGYKFMGKAHSNAYKSVGMFFPLQDRIVMKAICGRDPEGVKKAAESWGWESY